MESADDPPSGVPDVPLDDLLDAFADDNDGDDFFEYADNDENDAGLQNCGPVSRGGRGSRRELPWRRVAVFEGPECADQALAALSEHAGDLWFQSKGRSGSINRKAHQVREGFPSAQTPRVTKDGTSTVEVKCPFHWVSTARLHLPSPLGFGNFSFLSLFCIFYI